MPDHNMISARLIGVVLFRVSYRPKQIPDSLQQVETRTSLVNDVDMLIGRYITPYSLTPSCLGQIDSFPDDRINDMLREIAKTSGPRVPEIADDNARTGLVLCLWSGCITAAKAIALGTMDGENTVEVRKNIFAGLIDPLSKIDSFFLAGVETAPVLKRLRSQGNQISFDGVPD